MKYSKQSCDLASHLYARLGQRIDAITVSAGGMNQVWQNVDYSLCCSRAPARIEADMQTQDLLRIDTAQKRRDEFGIRYRGNLNAGISFD